MPETGYVSDSRYFNAFFGFSFPLPQNAEFRDLVLPSSGNSHFIFGAKAERKGLTALTVSADLSTGDQAEAARVSAGGPRKASAKKVEIGGKEFWKSESEDSGRGGTMHTLIYTIAMNGYTLRFMVVSFDGKLIKELRHSFESINFFDPAQAKVLAGNNARLFPAKTGNTSSTGLSPTHIAGLSPGAVSGNTYTNNTLGFSFQFPAGWIVADKSTQEKVAEAGHQFAYGDDPTAAREHEAVKECGRVLLLTTRYPEGTKTEGVNPLVAIMAFDSDCLPDMHLPTSTADQEAIRQLALKDVPVTFGSAILWRWSKQSRDFHGTESHND